MNKINVKKLVEFLESNLSVKLRNIPEINELEVTELAQNRNDTFNWSKSEELNWSEIESAIIIVPKNCRVPQKVKSCVVKVGKPRLLFTKILRHFFVEEKISGVMGSSVIGENCKIDPSVSIGHNCVIGNNVTISSGTVIEHNVVIHDNCIINKNCFLKSGCIIGGTGFGFEKNNGNNIPIPHIGYVCLGNDVQIGSYTCIDRGTLGTTEISDGVKIDDHSFLAHNVKINSNCIICSHVVICGSVVIGKDSWISPGSLIRNGIHIGSNVIVGLGATVVSSVIDNLTVVGNPAKPLKS